MANQPAEAVGKPADGADLASATDPATAPRDVLAEIRSFIANWFRDGKEQGLEPETPLVTSGIVDSAGVIEVVEFLEQRFGVRLQDADVSLANCNTLRGLTDLVKSRMSA